ncbi:MAG TPA: M56 family metallopeptidase [Planctomycetaceae bacterium]|jgi:beta-lactamase regulating signal transducer with metallopeptidase domain|nr:M56 family metallopeptidase [Planctomycetaceae bacterium]
MPNDMHLITFPIARLALAYLLHSTLLLGGTWLVLRAARVRSWALEERLWKLAVILPLITAAIPLPPSWSRPLTRLNFERVLPLPQKLEPTTALFEVTRHPVIAIGSSPADQTDLPVMDDAARGAEPNVASSEERRFQATPMSTALPTRDAQTFETAPTGDTAFLSAPVVAGICYTVVSFLVLGALHVIRRSIVFRRSLCDCRPAWGEPICDVLDEVLRRTNVGRRVRLLVSTSDRPPAAFGLFRWTIVLPHELIPTLQPDELRALLSHEVAHLARGDAVWLWIGRIACACFAFQPLNFLARGRLRLAAEFLCDDWAVRNSANRFALARCLTRVAEWSAPFSPQPLELAAVGTESNLSERVESLILERPRDDAWNSGVRRVLVWAVAVAVACGVERCAPRSGLLAEPTSRALQAVVPGSSEHSQPGSKAIWTDTLVSLSHETHDLLSELQQVELLLKRNTPPDPALAAVAVRLKSRVALLVNDQARLAAFQASASRPKE